MKKSVSILDARLRGHDAHSDMFTNKAFTMEKTGNLYRLYSNVC